MRFSRLMRDESGFTIQELLVVLMVGSILVSFTYSLFLSSSKLLESWRKRSALREAVTRTLQSVAIDILRARDISELSDSSLVIVTRKGTETVYHLNRGRVQRNDEFIEPGGDIAITLTIAEVGRDNQHGRLLDVKVRGRLRNTEYLAETEVSPPLSSRAEFLKSNRP